ncbi:MAG: hemin receptor [Bacteroidales bacterium]
MLGIVLTGSAQNEFDALRYSMTQFGGTARNVAMAGSFGSLGADFSTLSTNPAGIGLYRKSEISFTPSFYTGSVRSDYLGSGSDDIQYNFNMGNAGFVMAYPGKSKGSAFKYFQFGFGVNRTNNFNTRQLVEGFGSPVSITQSYANLADGIPYTEFEQEQNAWAFDLSPAWYTYMFDTIPGSDQQYYSAVPQGSGIDQVYTADTWGSMNEMVLSFGTNVSDRLYIGATMGIPYIRYFEETRYREIDSDNSIDGFDELSRISRLTTKGSGVNFKLGMIVRATNWFRFGGAIHSPTWYNNMHDTWSSDYYSWFDNGDAYNRSTPVGNYDYNLQTPWKALGNVSFIFFRMLAVSAEYEYLDYSTARLRAPGYDFFEENRAVKSEFRPTHNGRIGLEFKPGMVYFRGGAAYYMSPYASEPRDSERFYLTGGLGIRDKHFYADFAFSHGWSDWTYYLFSSPDVVPEPVKNTTITNQLLLTIGFRY